VKVKLQVGGETVWEGNIPQTPGLILRSQDNKAELQVEWNAKELRVSGDGGRNGSWETEIVVPRVREPSK